MEKKCKINLFNENSYFFYFWKP